MRRRVIFVLVLLMAGVGCTTVQRESRRARNVVVSTGEGIESGVNTAAHKTRGWWSRLFGGGGSSSQNRSGGGAASSNGRYETLAPQYVGTDEAVDGR